MNEMSRRNPYKSPKRNEPRTLVAPPPLGNDSVDDQLAANIAPKAGALTYRSSGPPFHATFTASKAENRRLILESFGDECVRLRDIIELEYRIAAAYFWIIDGLPYAQPNTVTRILQGTFAGSLVALNSALELTLDGLYSNARPLMRMALEGSLIAKLSSLDPQSDVYDRWLDGQYIHFSSDVLARITAPDVTEFRRLWQKLSGYTHASYYSGQADFCNTRAIEEAPLNFVFLQMLLEANYHLLCSHIVTDSLRYYEKNWGSDESTPRHKAELRKLFREGKHKCMGTGARTFVKHYRATWTLRP